MGIVGMLDAVTLQGAQVIGVAEFLSQLLEDRPVALLRIGADLARQMAPQVVGYAVVVEQRVVDVEQEHDRAWGLR